jgi:VIT1/CCC1 family predicted Fe2+/Mn2+ transporter
MNPRIKELAEQAQDNGDAIHYYDPIFAKKFAELIVAECIEIAKAEMFSKEVIDQEEHIEDREYLRGNNGGIVDAVVSIRNHFRNENEII